jgi:hypothetical protein
MVVLNAKHDLLQLLSSALVHWMLVSLGRLWGGVSNSALSFIHSLGKSVVAAICGSILSNVHDYTSQQTHHVLVYIRGIITDTDSLPVNKDHIQIGVLTLLTFTVIGCSSVFIYLHNMLYWSILLDHRNILEQNIYLATSDPADISLCHIYDIMFFSLCYSLTWLRHLYSDQGGDMFLWFWHRTAAIPSSLNWKNSVLHFRKCLVISVL